MRAQSQYRQPPSPFESEESDIEVETVHTPESYIGEVHGRQGLNDVLGDIRDIAGDTRDDRMSVETMTAQISLSSQDSLSQDGRDADNAHLNAPAVGHRDFLVLMSRRAPISPQPSTRGVEILLLRCLFRELQDLL